MQWKQRVNNCIGIMRTRKPLDLSELRKVFRPFCEKHRIRRMEVFGSTALGRAAPGSDVDLLVTLDEAIGVVEKPPVDLLALDEALSKLAQLDPRKSQIVELRFFGGLSEEQIAEVLGSDDRRDTLPPSSLYWRRLA